MKSAVLPDSARAIRMDLRRRILAQEWEVGARLPGERALALEYRVSRPVIREALSALASDSLIVISPARGAFVSAPNGSALTSALSSFISAARVTVREVADAREVVEGACLVRAASHASPAQLDRLAQLAEQIDTGEDRVDQAIADLAFHNLTCIASGNAVLSAVHRASTPHILMMMLRAGRDPGQSAAEHARIVSALRAHDATSALELLRTHLGETATYFGNDFDRPLDEVAAENLARISGGLAGVDAVVALAEARLDTLTDVDRADTTGADPEEQT